MKRAILIHGWEETPKGQWLPWLGKKLEEEGWKVEIPEMPHTKNPKLTEWMDTLMALAPDENTLLIGHSLGNALVLKYLENPKNKANGAVLVAVWDWLMEDLREFHETFFENEFAYEAIKKKNLPLVMVNSTTDPWIDFEKSKLLAEKIHASFVAVENAGHFMERDGYKEFPLLLQIIKEKMT